MSVSVPTGTLISKKLWDERELLSLSANIAETNRELVGSNSRTLRIPIRKYNEALILDAEAAASPQAITWDYVDVTIDKRLHQSFYISYLTDKISAQNIAQKQIEISLKAMARTLDRWVLQTAAGYTSVTGENIGTGDGTNTDFNVSHTPILEVSAVYVDGSPVSNYTVDYDDGVIHFASAPGAGEVVTIDYGYADSDTHTYHVSSAGSLTLEDFFHATTEMEARGHKPEWFIIPPRAEFLLQNSLVSKFQFTQGTTKVPGLIGAIGDVKVVVTDLLPDNYAILLKGPPNGGVMKIHASDVIVKKLDRPDYARTDIYLDEWVKPVRVLPDAIEVIYGFGTKAV